MVTFQNAFISYGRADSKAFAIQLNQRLSDAGLTVWFDADDIPFGIDYQNEIDVGIANADNFLYVISPHAVNSPYCDKELLLALTYNKRIIPLMHVEDISYDTWQHRNPDGGLDAWQDYQAKGLHSSHVNLNPAVGRINWIFFCEGTHDFEQSCQDLLNVISLHADYTRQHTFYLTQALRWEEHERQAPYLLSSEQSTLGREWLQTQFLDSLPPCNPTDLHCEFLAESLKANNQGMTHVFLSYSEEDRNHQHHLRNALMRRGFTVWTNITDIRTGVEFQQAIYEGIEKADTIVFLVSPNSIKSKYCQDELAYGVTYNKRIIPVLIQPMQVDTLPKMLQSVQFIKGFKKGAKKGRHTPKNKSDNPFPEEAIAQLIRTLYDHADYYTQHKELLVKALEWDRRDRPDSLALHNQEFVAAEAWWEISQQTAIQPPPTRLHQAFIQASQSQNRFFDAFISYGRADSLAFASQLNERLSNQGFNVWFDQEDIPVGVDFQAQIDDGIEKAHNFIFIIAPHAVHSPYCLKEIEVAIRLNKRIIPLMHVEEIGYETWQHRHPNQSAEKWDEYQAEGRHSSYVGMHPEITKINWIFCREQVDAFDTVLAQLTTLLRQHESYVRRHTALLTQALDWQQHNCDVELLLTGDNRQQATQWLKEEFQDQQAPCYPTVLHSQFITESIKQANNQMTDVFLCYAVRDGAMPFAEAERFSKASNSGDTPNTSQEEALNTLPNVNARFVTLALTAPYKLNHYSRLLPKIYNRLVSMDAQPDSLSPPSSLSQLATAPSSSPALSSLAPSSPAPSSPATSASTRQSESIIHPSFAASFIQYIRYQLIRAGFTVWDYTNDIRSGETIQTATHRGIETADTFIFLLSNRSLQSPRCQQELHYALQLNKRIVPIKIGALRAAEPDSLAHLNRVDLSHIAPEVWMSDRTYAKSKDYFRPLFQTLQQDQAYYQTHKRLLAIALKWDRQQNNPTVLLRGNTLKQYDNWLQIAQKRNQHPPIDLQAAFVDASKQQPPTLTLDVFIIYAPEDFVFVRVLNETLQIQNKTTWFDETVLNASIQDLETLEQEVLNEGIDQSENILFVVSPSAIKNPRCVQELNYAHQQNKRIIPILYREVLSAKSHPVLDQTPWLDFQPKGNFSTQFGILFRQLESNPEHIRPHTRLLVRSREWAEAERDKSYLLRGKELQLATEWLTQAEGKTPPPTSLQREFITESQALPFRKLKKRSIVLTSIISAGVIFGLRLFGLLLPSELWAYDKVLQLKPDEPQDDRFLIVQVDDESGRWLRESMKDGTYTPGIGSVPEAAMATAIQNLQTLNPSLIGLDFYRDFKADPEMADLLANSDNLIGLCKSEDKTQGYPGFSAAAEMARDRVGFSDFDTDNDNYVRRHLIKNSVDSDFCNTEDSFSLVVARHYLENHNQPYTTPWPDDYTNQPLKFGTISIPQLSKERGSAYSIPNQQGRLGGYQTLLKFRTYRGPNAPNTKLKAQNFAPHLSIQDVIQNNIPESLVNNRIVLIGYVDESDTNADFYNTPYGRVPGVMIQGQKISQLISHVLDNRSLIWWWSLEGELLWILSWTLLVGFVVWGIVRTRRLILILLGTLMTLPVICIAAMVLWSGWIPLIPTVLSASVTALITAGRNKQIRNP